MSKHTILLKLYISGMTPAAKRAIENLDKICQEVSNDHQYAVKVMDIREHPNLAEDNRILATPTVIKELPPPIKRIVGDLSDIDRVLVGLDLVES